MKHSLLLIFGLLILISLSSCSTPQPEGETEAQILYNDASKLVENGRYLLATEKLNKIRSKFPYSYFATHAELLSADILFYQENFAEAAAAYILFKDFHPKHEKRDYVIFRIAESFYFQVPPTFDRDLSPAVQAITYFQELLSFYPGSKYVEGANKKIAECQKMLWQKEQYIADFYFKTEVYDSARFRYLDILKNFSGPSNLMDHSMVRIVESSLRLGEKDQCLKYSGEFLGRLAGNVSKKRVVDLKEKCQ